jgi:hypothetical protein
MSQIQHDIEFLGKHPFLAICLNVFSITITFIDSLETTLKIIALIVSIAVGIITFLGKLLEIRKHDKSK